MKRILNALCIVLAVALCLPLFMLTSMAAEGDTFVYSVDSINGIRWENYICIYRDIETTGQNVYGCNIIVDGNNVVTEKIPAGDPKGENLAIPEGCFVVSGIGATSETMFNSVNIGDNVFLDEYGMRVMFSSSEISSFTEYEMTATGINTVRGDNAIIIYNKSGQRTGTNSYGREAVVNSDGVVISVGANDNLVPEGGFVVSVVGSVNNSAMLANFTVGAKCTVDGKKIKVVYDAEGLKATADIELDLVKSALETAKQQYRLIDYTAVEAAINAIDTSVINSVEKRNEVITKIKAIKPMLIEQKEVETRSAWHEPTQRTAEDVKKTVEQVKAAKLNEFIIYLTSANGTLVPIPDSIPFDKDPITESFDLLQTYIDECKKNNIKLVVVIPVMSNPLADEKTEWHDVTNNGEKGELFYSPANKQYRKAFMDYITYILENYDVDGLQLDYIRYIGYFGGGTESGYDDDSIALFEEKTGLGADVVAEIGQKQENHVHWNKWRNFKVELINGWVKDCYDLVKSIRPDIFVTAAVAESVAKEAYSQDYDAWLKGGYIDGIYPMTYTQGVNKSTAEKFVGSMTDKSFVAMGSGTYLFRPFDAIIDENTSASVYGADGIAYFEWTSVRDFGYATLFAETLFADDAIPLSDDCETVVTKLLETAKKRVALYNGENAEAVKSAVDNTQGNLNSVYKAVEEIENATSAEDAKYLTADLKRACKVLRLNGFELTEEALPDDGEENDGEPKNETDWTKIIITAVIIIAVLGIAAFAVAAVIGASRKKNA